MIRDFHSAIDGLGAKGILCTWLHCLEVLSASKIHTKTFTGFSIPNKISYYTSLFYL
jgi:hypothetical protein